MFAWIARGFGFVILASAPATAYAHHMMDGQTPATLVQGLLSGLGHPIIGIDHFAFIVGIGLLAAVSGLGPLLPAAFVVAMCAGLGLHFLGVDIAGTELIIAASVVLIGIAVLRPRTTGSPFVEGALFAAAGALHGYALAETIIGAEQGVVGAYVVGLIIIQTVLSSAVYFGARAAARRIDQGRFAPIRAAGAGITAAGLVFLIGATGILA